MEEKISSEEAPKKENDEVSDGNSDVPNLPQLDELV